MREQPGDRLVDRVLRQAGDQHVAVLARGDHDAVLAEVGYAHGPRAACHGEAAERRPGRGAAPSLLRGRADHVHRGDRAADGPRAERSAGLPDNLAEVAVVGVPVAGMLE